MGQELAEIWTAQTDLQPGRPKSDRLPAGLAPKTKQVASNPGKKD
jgi:hypothetical protein